MRILILGSNRVTTSRLAVLCQKTIDKPWQVVSSFENCKNFWKGVPNVDSVVSAVDFKENNTINLIVDNVIAKSFYTDTTQLVDRCENLIVATADPISTMDKKTLDNFDKIMVSKTTGVDKQSQYYTLFVDAKGIEFKGFKTDLAKLKNLEYLEISSVGKLSYPFTDGSKTLTENKLDVPPEVQQVVDSLQNLKLVAPTEIQKPDNTIEMWVCIHVNDKTATLTKFKTMIGNDIVKCMYHSVSFQDNQDNIVFYFQVRMERQDLFTSLIMNILRALRTSLLISQGCLCA